MLDDADRIAVALQVLAKRYRLNHDALGALLRDHYSEEVVARAMVRGVGVVCDAEICSAWAAVPHPAKEEARQLLILEQMQDLLDPG